LTDDGSGFGKCPGSPLEELFGYILTAGLFLWFYLQTALRNRDFLDQT
jgi:hypothetical protein